MSLFLINSIICLIILFGFSANAQNISHEILLKEFLSYLDKNEYEDIYTNLATSRFKKSCDFNVFKKKMKIFNKKMGRIRDCKVEFYFEDNHLIGVDAPSFIRMQYEINYDFGNAQERVVFSKEHQKWLVDGFAIYSNEQIQLGQGNIDGFEVMNTELSRDEPVQAKAWLSIKNNGLLRDSNDKEFIEKQYRQQFLQAILIAQNGNFSLADQKLEHLFYNRELILKEPNRKVIKDVLTGKIPIKAGQLYLQSFLLIENKKNWKLAASLIEQAISLDKEFIDGHILAASAYMQMEEWQQALEHINSVLRIDPENVKCHGLLEIYYTKIGDMSKAKDESRIYFQEYTKSTPVAQMYINRGFAQKFYDNGNLEFRATFVGGRPDGPYKVFFPSGDLKEEGQYSNGKQDGQSFVYYTNGKINMEMKYDNGRLKYLKHYDESGSLIEEYDL